MIVTRYMSVSRFRDCLGRRFRREADSTGWILYVVKFSSSCLVARRPGAILGRVARWQAQGRPEDGSGGGCGASAPGIDPSVAGAVRRRRRSDAPVCAGERGGRTPAWLLGSRAV